MSSITDNVLEHLRTSTPPPKALTEQGTRRTQFSIEGVMAECMRLGHDPNYSMAMAFSPAVVAEFGEIVVARFGLDLLKLKDGEKVRFDGTVDHGYSNVSLPDAERILAQAIGQGPPGDRETPSET